MVARSLVGALALAVLAGGVSAAPGEITGFRRQVRDGAVHLVVACSAPVTLERSSGDALTIRLRLGGVSRGAPAVPEAEWAEDVETVSVEPAGEAATTLELQLREPVPYQVQAAGRELSIVLGRTPDPLPDPEPAVSGSASSIGVGDLPEPIDLTPPTPVDTAPAPRASRVYEARREPGSPLTIHVPTDGAPEYSAFLTQDGPVRLVVDVVGVESRPLFSRLEVGVGPLRAVRVAQHAAGPPPVVRVVFDLDARVAHRIAADPTGLTVVFDGVE